MPQVSRRRADQLGDFVLHLKLAAVDAHQALLAAVQNVRQRLHRAGLAGAGGTQQQEHARRPALGTEPGAIHLDVGNNLGDGVGLPHQAARKLLREFLAPAGRAGKTGDHVPPRTYGNRLARAHLILGARRCGALGAQC